MQPKIIHLICVENFISSAVRPTNALNNQFFLNFLGSMPPNLPDPRSCFTLLRIVAHPTPSHSQNSTLLPNCQNIWMKHWCHYISFTKLIFGSIDCPNICRYLSSGTTKRIGSSKQMNYYILYCYWEMTKECLFIVWKPEIFGEQFCSQSLHMVYRQIRSSHDYKQSMYMWPPVIGLVYIHS